MSDKQVSKNVVRRKGNPGFMGGLTNQIRLVLRLMADPRVNPLVKLLPVGAIVYLIFPDLIPGPFDDAAIIGLGTYFFFELCPPEVVEEHRAAIWGAGTTDDDEDPGEVVDAEFTE